MKTSKEVETSAVTPPHKKLKQARLPFKLISDVSPKPPSPPTRKRKLSVSDTEPSPKVGKISKENGLIQDLVVISDDDSKDANNLPSIPKKEEKLMNPYVKLVDTVLKKKQLKKTPKRKGKKSSKKVAIETVHNNNVKKQCEEMEVDDVEIVDVSDKIPTDDRKIVQNDESPNDNSCENEQSRQNTASDSKKLNPETSISGKEQEDEVHENDTDDPNKTKDANTKDLDSEKLNTQPTNSKSEKSIKLNKVNDIKKPNNASKVNILIPRSSPRTVQLIKPQQSEDISEKTEVFCIEDSNSCSENKEDDNKKDSNIKITSDDNKHDNTEETQESKTDNSDITMKSPEKSPASPLKENENEREAENQVTPKRSSRNRAKKQEETNLDTSSTKHNESVSSDATTPKQKSRSSSVTNSLGDQSLNDSISTANLTPKQLAKKLEASKKREEREKEKQEREKKRQQEKEEREKQRKEKEEQKRREREEKEEQKKREREEKEEQRRKEREEKEKQKEMERKLREMKEEQKRKEKEDKEEQRRKEKEAREEEKRKRQEALELEKQEQELKKKKAAEAFVSFFVPKQKVEKDQTVGPVSKNDVLSSFTIKADMRLAPTCRVDLSDEKREMLDKALEEQNFTENDLYLTGLKEGTVKPMSSSRTWPLDDKDDDDDVMIVEDELPPIDSTGQIVTCEPAPRERLRAKLLSFHQNRRPPYWGTWRKKSAFIKPRRPFGQDEKQLDYEVDSDEEWEEEQDGESVDGSACGSEDEGGEDEYEVDNEVFVPHGYLSDEEATMEDDVLSLTPETQKARLKHLEDEFETELKKPTEKLKPRLYGLLWESSDGGKPENCVDALWNYFSKFSMILNDPAPLLQPSKEPEEVEKKKIKKKKAPKEGEEQSPKREKKKKQKIEQKEIKKVETKKTAPNQPGINTFLSKMKPA